MNNKKKPMHIVWFKRDLRIQDHSALTLAAEQGAVLPLYIVEPELWQQPDASQRHYRFLKSCLVELDEELARLGQRLIVKLGDAVAVLTEIEQRYSIAALWSHQETGNAWSYARDRRVKAWARAQAIPWHEPPQHGVIRCLDNRDSWGRRWQGYMRRPQRQAPKALTALPEPTQRLPDAQALGLLPDGASQLQLGGRKAGLACLSSFLEQRGEDYTKAMSSPLTAYDACSRLSPHFTWGTLSIREVFQLAEVRARALYDLPPALRGRWPSALRSFLARLRWHCHFIQKLEDWPDLEFKNLHSAYDGLREGQFNAAHFAAWQAGQTGYPLVDACMRALTATGWLNFRMRAMLMSFAAYHLWLHWREPALHLARLFTDYEPGIHFSQAQMQSGTTGINAIRIYNPIKQAIDQDPEGQFIRAWIPELSALPNERIHQPTALDRGSYPPPLVEEKAARKAAADRLYAVRKRPEHRPEAQQIVTKHGSRRRPSRQARAKASAIRKTSAQLEFSFEAPQ
jgi:deoxyribodipyrimidine photo-lyase